MLTGHPEFGPFIPEPSPREAARGPGLYGLQDYKGIATDQQAAPDFDRSVGGGGRGQQYESNWVWLGGREEG